MKRVLSFRILASIGVVTLGLAVTAPRTLSQTGVTEPRAGLTATSNGFAEEFCGSGQFRQENVTNSPNSPRIPRTPTEEDPNVSTCSFAAASAEFGGIEGESDGLGPIFNNDGCGTCHFTPALGGSSHVNEKRAGTFANGIFTDHPGGSLIQDRALDPSIQEVVTDPNANVFALRTSLGIAGDGYLEAVSNTDLQAISDGQPAGLRGQVVTVPVGERPGTNRIGRFGWKAQQASLVSFAADAYVNEMGITSPLQPTENSFNGDAAAAARFDHVPAGNPSDVDTDGVDVELFALFMRSLPVPARGPITASVTRGAAVFDSLQCDTCHRPTLTTVAPGTLINGGALRVGNVIGNKLVRPFSDLLLHDVGTGDGIVQNGGQQSRNRLRTAPLWGLRTRGRFMHDGASLTLDNAVRRHGGQATTIRNNYAALPASDRADLLNFLRSL